jgi:hypothetical protein
MNQIIIQILIKNLECMKIQYNKKASKMKFYKMKKIIIYRMNLSLIKLNLFNKKLLIIKIKLI